MFLCRISHFDDETVYAEIEGGPLAGTPYWIERKKIFPNEGIKEGEIIKHDRLGNWKVLTLDRRS